MNNHSATINKQRNKVNDSTENLINIEIKQCSLSWKKKKRERKNEAKGSRSAAKIVNCTASLPNWRLNGKTEFYLWICRRHELVTIIFQIDHLRESMIVTVFFCSIPIRKNIFNYDRLRDDMKIKISSFQILGQSEGKREKSWKNLLAVRHPDDIVNSCSEDCLTVLRELKCA